MLERVRDILSAEGSALLAPLGFGSYRGRSIDTIPREYWSEVEAATKGRAPAEVLAAKAQAAGELRAAAAKMRPGLRAHQKEFVELFHTRPAGFLLAGIGTGKTIAIVELMRLGWRKGDRALVICPKSVFKVWMDEAWAWARWRVVVASGDLAHKRAALSVESEIVVTNYESFIPPRKGAKAASFADLVLAAGFSWLILDESHRIKTPNAKTTKTLLKVSRSFRRRFCLTGTPITNRELDAYSQVTILDGGQRFGLSWYKFRGEFFKPDYMGFNYTLRDDKRTEFEAAIASISYRVDAADVLDLPPKVFERREVELKGESLRRYKEMVATAILILEDKTITAQHKAVELRRLHQIAGGGVGADRFGREKLDELFDLREEIAAPCVVVAVYTDEIAAIAAEATRRKLAAAVISGAQNNAQRAEAIAKFRAGKLDLIILQPRAGGAGIDGLQTHARHMIFYSTDYGWADREQVEGRIYRSGQPGSCVFVDLVAVLPGGKPSIDAAVLANIAQKTDRIENFLKNVKSILKGKK